MSLWQLRSYQVDKMARILPYTNNDICGYSKSCKGFISKLHTHLRTVDRMNEGIFSFPLATGQSEIIPEVIQVHMSCSSVLPI